MLKGERSREEDMQEENMKDILVAIDVLKEERSREEH